MDRRTFLGSLAAAALAGRAAGGDDGPRIMSVRGPIDPDELGVCLPHEHVLVDFAGAEVASPDRYDADEVVRVARPHLERVRTLGGRSFVDCTPAYLARDPRILRKLSELTGLHILTNTGLYAANGGKHLPGYARTEDAEALAARWLAEWRDGIGGTGIRPGLIKIGLDAGRPDAVGEAIVRAAARAHLRTGLTIASHTGDLEAASWQLRYLSDEGVDPSAWIWVHAQNVDESDRHVRLASIGGWVEFDGLAPESVDVHVRLVKAVRDAGHLGRVLVSHDAGWYHVGEPGGGTYRPHDTLFTAFLPALREAGFDEAEVRKLTVENPREAFTIRPRPAA